jgi:D-3-phosphoglycerate dehydrogenase
MMEAKQCNKKFKLVVLSRSFAKASDKPLEHLKKYAELEYKIVRNNSPEDRDYVAAQIGDADSVIVGSDVIDRYVLDKCPNLKVISKHGVGLDNIDLKLAQERGITVTKTTLANNEAVADLTLLMMLAVLRKLPERTINSDTPDWSPKPLTHDLYQKTVGIIGYGEIGRSVARRLAGFSCEILAYDPCFEEAGFEKFVKKAELEEIYSASDIITLHAPLNEKTRQLINGETLRKMKEGVVIINTSRGDLIDEKALYQALVDGKVQGAGLDVFSKEPPVGEPLLTLPNVVATPHIATHTVESNYRMGIRAVENVIQVLFHGADNQ